MNSIRPNVVSSFAARTGLAVLLLLVVAFFGTYLLLAVPESKGMDFFLHLTPWLVIPYLVLSSIYAGSLAFHFSKGHLIHKWLWSAGACILSLSLGLGFSFRD